MFSTEFRYKLNNLRRILKKATVYPANFFCLIID